ncbi:MAG: carboxypeptidase regulatory-like domain-containing protein [Pseudohongiellaceae bacterium]
MRYPNSAKKLLCVSMLAAMGFSAQVAAQDTSSAIRGRLVDANGNPMANATIVVEDSRTGATRTLQSNDTGTFYATNLPVGGPYTVRINNQRTVTIDTIELGDTYNLTVDMGASQVEEIIVLGQANTLVDVAAGPSATFGSFDLDTAVAYNRDIRDVYSLDPRFNLDGDARDAQTNCIGKHPRFNSIMLDGVAQNDRFGLNGNGYATATGMPFPYAAVSQVSAELAPFDVTYGGFSACNIQAVTKSGTNEFTGSVFYEFTNEGLRGDSLERPDGSLDTFTTPDYDEEYKGFSLGGPILQDRLFFFTAYEESEQPEFIGQGFAGSSNGVERDWLDQDTFNLVNNAARDLYNIDTGGLPTDGTQTAESWMGRLDWNISDRHTAALIYNKYDGVEDRASDGDQNEFEFANHFYQKGADLETWTVKLKSQWTNAFSTDIFYNTNEMLDSQVTVGPQDVGDHQISVNGQANVIYLGADDSRQANALNWESAYYRFLGEYLIGEHIVTFGYERDELDVFNQFVQHSNGGEYDYFDDSLGNPAACDALDPQGRFDAAECSLSGIDRFLLGRPSRVYYGSGGGTNDPADASARFRNNMDMFYLQDEWYLPNYNLTLVGGLRYERMSMDDRPQFNQAFLDTVGIRNDANLDGVDLWMPRLGFTWEADYNLTVRGGVGLYSGGNPNVWVTNAWSNDGISNVQLQFRNFDGARSLFNDVPLSGQGRPGYDVPQTLVDQVANTTAASGSDEALALIDPDYEQPSEWKYSLGATYTFDSGLSVDGDIIYSRQNNPAYYEDVSQAQVGTTAAGAPIFDYVRGEDNYMLTNANTEGEGLALSLIANQRYDWGLDWMLGYAYTDQTDVSGMTSAVAGSNFSNLTLTTLVDPQPATSEYVTPHRFTARVSYGRDFIPGHETRFTAYMFRQQGQPQSHVMSSADLEGDGFFGRHQLYVPTLNDPNVVIGPNFDVDAWARFVENQGYTEFAGGFVPRNENFADWSTRLDFRIDQELPLFFGTRARAYLKVYNMLNMLNDSWGVQNNNQFFAQVAVDSSLDDQGRYVFEQFNNRSLTDLQENSSLYEIRMGLQFEF